MSTLHFDEASHAYFVDGVRVPGVTSIIESVGLVNFFGVSLHVLEDARELGTAVHRATELSDQGTLDESTVDPLVAPYLDAWHRFRAVTDIEVLDVERRVHHALYGYAGTLDRTVRLAGRKALLDIKTGGPQRATGVQTAAYLAASGLPPKSQRFACHLQADGNYKLVEYKDPSDFPIFLSALSIWKWRNK